MCLCRNTFFIWKIRHSTNQGVAEFQNCCVQQENQGATEVLKRTVGTLTEILTGYCVIGNFAGKLGLPHQDYGRNCCNVEKM